LALKESRRVWAKRAARGGGGGGGGGVGWGGGGPGLEDPNDITD